MKLQSEATKTPSSWLTLTVEREMGDGEGRRENIIIPFMILLTGLIIDSVRSHAYHNAEPAS